MTVITKYSKGESVWMMQNNKPIQKIVFGLEISVGKAVETERYGFPEPFINYVVDAGLIKEARMLVPEESLYKTKQDLLNSL